MTALHPNQAPSLPRFGPAAPAATGAETREGRRNGEREGQAPRLTRFRAETKTHIAADAADMRGPALALPLRPKEASSGRIP